MKDLGGLKGPQRKERATKTDSECERETKRGTERDRERERATKRETDGGGTGVGVKVLRLTERESVGSE